MKRVLKFLLVISIVAFSINAQSQQLPLYSQYMMNGFLLNPAMAGAEKHIPIRLTARQQWAGITDAPATYALSGHTPIGESMGAGGYVFTDMFGPTKRTGIQGSYSYHLTLGNDLKLGLGLSLSAFQYSLDETSLVSIESGDDAISGAVESTFVPDANFGAYLYSEKYFVGLAVQQLVQLDIQLGENSDNVNQMVRHYFITGGYTFDAGSDFKVQPSLLLKGTESSPFQVDVNVKAIYKDNYWMGISYRTSDAVIALLGVKYDKYYFGYAFDFTLSNISNYTTGSHEIMLGINLGGKDSGSRLLGAL